MVLNDAEITARIANERLLVDHDAANVRNCAYTLRAGKVFLPGTGEEELLHYPVAGAERHLWQIGPSEVLVVRTYEGVRMPDDLCATYAPLYRLSRQGVMLLNASLVEPGYYGRLSCFLVNFSSQTITIGPRSPIAKIVFHRVPRPTALVLEPLDDASYDRGLADSAKKFHRSFMDVAGIADRAAEKATAAAKRAVVFGGIAVAFLLLWAQMEPLISTWLRKVPGWPTNAIERAQVTAARQEVESKMKELEFARSALQLQSELQSLKIELQSLKAQMAKSK
jgi:deoxycytidine triphosphate deaminase